MDIAFDLAHMLRLFLAELIGGLEIDPELGRSAKKDGEPQGCVCRDATTALQNVRDAAYRHVETESKTIHAHAVRHQEFLIQNFAGMRYRCGEGPPACWSRDAHHCFLQGKEGFSGNPRFRLHGRNPWFQHSDFERMNGQLSLGAMLNS